VGRPGDVRIPPPRGELSAWLAGALQTGRGAGEPPAVRSDGPPWLDDDLQLALWCGYELHYRGFDGVPAELEWSPELLGFRAGLERQWLAGLRELAGEAAAPEADASV
jgi:hypothetical protein